MIDSGWVAPGQAIVAGGNRHRDDILIGSGDGLLVNGWRLIRSMDQAER